MDDPRNPGRSELDEKVRLASQLATLTADLLQAIRRGDPLDGLRRRRDEIARVTARLKELREGND